MGAFGSEAGCERGEVRNQQAKGIEGYGVRMLALAAFLVAWRVSLRSPCATADSQRTICIIRTLQLQIKKEKQNKIGKNKQHVRVRGILLDFHDYCFQIQVSFYLIQNWEISIAYFKKCLLSFVKLLFSFGLQRKPQDRGAQAWSEVVFLLLAVTNPLPYFWTLSEWWPQLAGRRGEDWGCPSVPFRQAPTQE